MANAEAVKSDEQAVQEFVAKYAPLFKRAEALAPMLSEFVREFGTFRTDCISAINHKENLSRLNREAELKVAKAEKEAQIRLQNVEQGHRAIIDRVTKKEVECEALKAELLKQQAALASARADAEALKAQREAELEKLTSVGGRRK